MCQQFYNEYCLETELFRGIATGGVPAGVAQSLWSLHQELQPDAVAFQGPREGGQPNLIRWAGTEGGHVQYVSRRMIMHSDQFSIGNRYHLVVFAQRLVYFWNPVLFCLL